MTTAYVNHIQRYQNHGQFVHNPNSLLSCYQKHVLRNCDLDTILQLIQFAHALDKEQFRALERQVSAYHVVEAFHFAGLLGDELLFNNLQKVVDSRRVQAPRKLGIFILGLVEDDREGLAAKYILKARNIHGGYKRIIQEINPRMIQAE